MSNDRLKFRVWDVENGSYFQPAHYEWINLSPDGDIIFGYGEYIHEPTPERWIVERCTGMKDKHGKLIFEGDVLRFYDPEVDKIIERDVIFDDECLEFCVTGSRSLLHCQFFNEFEIIGNIHKEAGK